MPDTLQDICAKGQELLLATEYIAAERSLVAAEGLALAAEDWPTLSRLYMPLQEARRQRRQRCGEGIVKLDYLAESAGDVIEAENVLADYPHGQFLVAGFGTLAPARAVLERAPVMGLYAESFLAASYRVNDAIVVAIVPTADVALPPAGDYAIDDLHRRLPPHSIVIAAADLPPGEQPGTPETFAYTMEIWERLHAPFLAMADAATDPRQKIALYRQTIAVDYACEKAHQRLSQTAQELGRTRRMG